MTASEEFTVEDFDAFSRLVLESWIAGADRDWTVPAGTLEWTCWKTAEHTIDCVFSYAFFLASRATAAYPPFDELRAFPHASPADMVDGLRASTNLLYASIITADPDVRAIISQRPQPTLGGPQQFAARGALEMILHGHDIATGLRVPLDPPDAECERLLEATSGWPGTVEIEASGDAWADLLVRSGRPRPR